MTRTNKQKLQFILDYCENFDYDCMLIDAFNMLTDSQIDELFEKYGESYKEAWEDYKRSADYYKSIDRYEEPEDEPIKSKLSVNDLVVTKALWETYKQIFNIQEDEISYLGDSICECRGCTFKIVEGK